jgi:signal transduction histidine kinase
MLVRQWLQPPRMLFVSLYALFALSALTVLWLGEALLDRDRAQRNQLRREELDQQAERAVLTLRELIADTAEHVTRWARETQPFALAPDSVLLLSGSHGIDVYPAGRILYVPGHPGGNEASTDVFREAEALEFRRQTAPQAAEKYRILAQSEQAPVRAGALLRLGRLLASSGQSAEALAVYQRLAAITGVLVTGAPAELIARHARLRLLDNHQRQLEAETLRAELAAGRWRLSRGQFDFFWSEVSLVPSAATRVDIGSSRALSLAAIEGYSTAMEDVAGQGQRSLWLADEPWFVLWRTSSVGRAVYVARVSSMLPVIRGFMISLRDAEGRSLAGSVPDGFEAAVRPTVGTGLPWTIAVVRDSKERLPATRPLPLLVLLTVMLGFTAAGTYFIGRAIRTEMETARLQSDFVAAVSHEFRSPLTTIRSLSEMLHAGRMIDENLPQYYRTLVAESARLQRLVETLLNFGRMESGPRRLRFEEVDAAELVRDVVAGFSGSERRIEVHGEPPIPLQADREAVGAAVRNLIENAIRYSPAPEPVEVRVTKEYGQVLIAVKDCGPGVPRGEREAIFQKFVRGSAAANGNVRGTGVGLAMVRHIAEAHHGKIELESADGKGSIFTLAIPLELHS